LAEFLKNVQDNAKLHEASLRSVPSFAELAGGSNVSFALGGYTPPCPWKADLNSDAQVVGTGSYGEVFLTTVKCQSSPKFPVAIKKMKDSTSTEVVNEAKIMDKFSSKHFVKVYGAGRSTKDYSNVYYLLMEAAEGGSFEGYVKNAGKSQNDFNTAVELWLDALQGVAEMHGMEYHHRDIKPDNILVTNKCGRGTTCHGKVADLGMSCHASKCTGSAGTPYYMAPEVVKYDFNARRNDVWSMGVILYRILNNGLLPKTFRDSYSRDALFINIANFNVKTELEFQAMSDQPLKSLLAEMLTSDVNKRLSTIEALDWALRAVRGCGVLVDEGDICEPDPTKTVQLLPSCWAGSNRGDWQASSPIKKESTWHEPPSQEKPTVKKQDIIAKPTVRKYEIETDFLYGARYVRQPQNEKRMVKKYVVEPDFKLGAAAVRNRVPQLVPKDIARINAQRERKHVIMFQPQALGLIVSPNTGAVNKVDDGQAKAAGVKPGWFVEEVNSLPYDFKLLELYVAGKRAFTVKFREPLITPQAEPEDDENFSVLTKKGKQANVKMFTVQYPKYTSGLGFLFMEQIVKDGVVQAAWPYLDPQHRIGIPIKPGDEFVSVNNQPWSQIVHDPQFIKEATEGMLGPLTFLYMAEA